MLLKYIRIIVIICTNLRKIVTGTSERVLWKDGIHLAFCIAHLVQPIFNCNLAQLFLAQTLLPCNFAPAHSTLSSCTGDFTLLPCTAFSCTAHLLQISCKASVSRDFRRGWSKGNLNASLVRKPAVSWGTFAKAWVKHASCLWGF